MYDKDNDIERIFQEDTREKKRTGIGIYHRASRLGYIRGGIKTQVDYLKGQAKKNYTKAGEIMEYNIYDDIEKVPSLEEIYKMDQEKAHTLLTYLKAKHNAARLREYFKVSSGKMYSIFDKYNVEYKKRDNVPKNTIPTLAELENMEFNEACNLLTKIREEFSTKELRKAWGVTDFMLYNHVFKKYNQVISPARNKGKKEKIKAIETIETIKTPSLYELQKEFDKFKRDSEEKIQEAHREKEALEKELLKLNSRSISEGYATAYKGKFTAKKIQNKLMNILGTLEEDLNYEIELVIRELESEKMEEQ